MPPISFPPPPPNPPGDENAEPIKKSRRPLDPFSLKGVPHPMAFLSKEEEDALPPPEIKGIAITNGVPPPKPGEVFQKHCPKNPIGKLPPI